VKYFRLLSIVGPRILWDFLFYINRYARHPERYPLEKRYKKVRALFQCIVKHLRLDISLQGLESLRELEKGDKCYLIVANHLSDLDPIFIVAYCEKPVSFVAKAETKKMPFIGKAVKAVDGVFMDRKDLRQSYEVLSLVQKRLESGYCSYLIFPEGTRNKQPAETPVAPYHPGSFHLAMAHDLPILPMALYGTFRGFKPHPDYRRLPIEWDLGKPLEKADYADFSTGDIAKKVHDWTDAKVALYKALDKDYFEKCYQKIPLKKGPVR
jgi:1-acyl-sn-glycerol-3-phosphate acyltransferase